MGNYFITGVNEDYIFIRKDGKTEVVTNDMPYLFHSYSQNNDEIKRINNLIGIWASDWDTEIIKQGITKSSIRTRCDFKDRSQFVKGFPRQKPSYVAASKWQTSFPFLEVKKVDEGIELLDSKVDLEELLNDTMIGLDIETCYPFSDDLYSIGATLVKNKKVVKDYRLVNKLSATGDPDELFFESEEDQVDGLKDIILEMDPLFIIGHYMLGFDLPELCRRHTKGSNKRKRGFPIGPNGNKPKKVGKTHPPKMTLDGRIFVDTYKPSLFKGLPNTKLDTVSRYRNLGEKMLTHKELQELTESALNGDLESKKTILDYNVKDVRLCLDIASEILPEILEISRNIGCDASAVGVVSWERLAERYLDKLSWEKGMSRKRSHVKEKSSFDYKKAIMKMLSREMFPKSVRGRFEDVSIICPSPKMFSPLYGDLEDILEKEGLFYNEALFALAKDALYDFDRFKKDKIGFNDFFTEHGVSPNDLGEHIRNYLTDLKKDLSGHQILNMSQDFIFVNGKLEESDNFFTYDVADIFLSMNKGTCFFKRDEKVYGTGMNVSKNYGFMVQYEKAVLGSLIEMAFDNNLEFMLPYIQTIKSELEEGVNNKATMVKEMTLGQDFIAYSNGWLKNNPSIANQIKGHDGGEVVPVLKTEEEILKSLFGPIKGNKRVFREGKVGKVLSTVLPFTKANKHILSAITKEIENLDENQTTLLGF